MFQLKKGLYCYFFPNFCGVFVCDFCACVYCTRKNVFCLLKHFAIPCSRYDSRVKAMEVDERPTEQYSDIGGLDKQIQEV